MRIKLILGISIIAFSAVASLYIVGSAEEPDLSLETFLSGNFLESVQGDFLFENISTDESGGLFVKELPPDHDNLTDILANAYARHLVNNFPEDLRALEAGEDIPLPMVELPDVIDEVFEKRALAIVADFKQDKFSVENIFVSSDNSLEAHEKYIQKVGESFARNLRGLEYDGIIIGWMRTGDPTEIIRYYKGMQRFVEEARVLEVPSDWVDFHLSALNMWHKQYAIFKAMPDAQTDPLKFIAATNSLEDLFEDAANFINSLIEVAKKVDERTNQ